MEAITPKDVRHYHSFVDESVNRRWEAEQKREATNSPVDREDMFHFLYSAEDPETGKKALTKAELRAEANLLLIAGTDTTSVAISSFFFFIVHNPRCYEKLVKEIRTTFSSPEEIVHGPQLYGCTYLRACIDESLRLAPAGPSEFPRDVLPGGATIDGEFYPPGTTVGIHQWSLGRLHDVYGDANRFRPERWIPSDDPDTHMANSLQDVRNLKRGFAPFLKGSGSCIGLNVAILQLSMMIARTLWRMDVRQAPDTDVGEGKPELGWGRSDPNHYIIGDAFVTLKYGPLVQFKKREF